MKPFTVTFCKVDRNFSRFKKFCELFLSITFKDLPYDKETNPDLTYVEATIPDAIVLTIAIKRMIPNDAPIEELKKAVFDALYHSTLLMEHITVKEEDERLAIMSMHKKAEIYEDAAFNFRRSGNIHSMHQSMTNAGHLRAAANLLDQTASNGG
jgi:hypothetical protein